MGAANHVKWQSGRDWHRHAVQQFVCTDPDKWQWDRARGKHHPRPWEIDVQSYIRNMKPRLPAGETLLLGMVGSQVMAVSNFGYDSTGEQFMVWAVARHIDARGQGLGAVAMDYTMKTLRATKQAEERDCGVFTRIHPENEPSKRLFARFGFEPIGVDGDLEYWVNDLQ